MRHPLYVQFLLVQTLKVFNYMRVQIEKKLQWTLLLNMSSLFLKIKPNKINYNCCGFELLNIHLYAC